MLFSFRPLLSFALAGAGLFLLSGCGEYDDGRAYHRHAYGYGEYRGSGRSYEDGYRRTTYDGGYRDYDRRPRYESDTRVVLVNDQPTRNYGPRYHDSVNVTYNEPSRSKYGSSQRGGSYHQAPVSYTQNRGYQGGHTTPPKTSQGNRTYNPNAGRPPATNRPQGAGAPQPQNHAPGKGKKKDPNDRS